MSGQFQLPISYLPGSRFLEKLEALITDQAAQEQLVSSCTDLRLTFEAQRIVLQQELMHLYQWVLKRLLSAARDGVSNKCVTITQVVCLLPRYGLLTHIIRRALPFACCDIQTKVAAPPRAKQELTHVVEEIRSVLGLTESLWIGEEGGDGPATLANAMNALVVITGRLSTVSMIHAKRGAISGCLGAAGRYSVILAESGKEAAHLRHTLAQSTPLLSCTRPRAAFCIHSPEDNVAVTTLSNLPKLLARIHPSVVLASQSLLPALSDVPGFTILACDSLGQTDSHFGLARDPRFGWPGDYCL